MDNLFRELRRRNVFRVAGVYAVVGWLLAQVAATPETPASAAAPAPIDRSKSIAVLPFADFSPDGDQEWFSDGLTEEILYSLARTPDLLVASRTSSFKYKDADEDMPVIAQRLGVEHMLEGSVRRAGHRLRVTAPLIRASDGFHLWSQTYDRSADDVIAIREEIAIEIAQALKTAMDPEALAEMVVAGTRTVKAHEAYVASAPTDIEERLKLIDTLNLVGDRAAALTSRIDDFAAGPAILGRTIAITHNMLFFELADAPNFAARLEEAGIDPASFRPMPRLSLQTE